MPKVSKEECPEITNKLTRIGARGTLKLIAHGIPIKGLSKEKIWLDIETPVFPIGFTLLGFLLYALAFMLAQSEIEYTDSELVDVTLRWTLKKGGFLLLVNVILMIWLMLILQIFKTISGVSVSVIRGARRVLYFSTIFQSIMPFLVMIAFGDLLGRFYSYGEHGFWSLVLLPKILDVSYPLIFFLIALSAFARILCVFQGVRLETSGSIFPAILSIVACIDSWYFLYLNWQLICFYFSA